jgi:hypothetical protein
MPINLHDAPGVRGSSPLRPTHAKFFTEDHSSSPKGVSLPILVRMSLGRSRFGQPLALDDVHGLLVRGSGNLEVAD